MLERRMANSFHLRCSTIFLAGAPEVWALKIDPESMQDEFRPFFSGDISAAKEAIAQLKAGNLPVCYNIQMKGAGLLPLGNWPVEIVEFEEEKRFVDCSTNAFFSEWRHEHLLEACSDGTRYVDRVDFVPTRQPRLTAIAVRELFLHRHRRASRHLPSIARATGIATLRELG
tara:strand:+ start:54 stop:569 length:516 start_codon:yes stop_codon:yes gene_type:complete